VWENRRHSRGLAGNGRVFGEENRALPTEGAFSRPYGALQEKHADAIHRMYEAAGVNLKTATEAEKASLRMRLIGEARKGDMRFPA
jgi:hypothetical protein